eukprot:353059-Chlamydomonas_euryale.AAC.4
MAKTAEVQCLTICVPMARDDGSHSQHAADRPIRCTCHVLKQAIAYHLTALLRTDPTQKQSINTT